MTFVEWLIVVSIAVVMLGIIAASLLVKQPENPEPEERRLEVSDTFMHRLAAGRCAAFMLTQMLRHAGFDFGREITRTYDVRCGMTVFTQKGVR